MPATQHSQGCDQDLQAVIQGLACAGLQFPIPPKAVPSTLPRIKASEEG